MNDSCIHIDELNNFILYYFIVKLSKYAEHIDSRWDDNDDDDED